VANVCSRLISKLVVQARPTAVGCHRSLGVRAIVVPTSFPAPITPFRGQANGDGEALVKFSSQVVDCSAQLSIAAPQHDNSN